MSTPFLVERFYSRILVFASAVWLACVHHSPIGEPIEREPRRELREGVYASCVGAYAHTESLVLRGGAFEHSIRTHGIYGGVSTGTYDLVGDTVVVRVATTAPLPAGVWQPLELDYDFVIGRHSGLDVLWRGRAAAARYDAQAQPPTPNAALFYGGPDPTNRDVPSCRDVRDRRTVDDRRQ